MNTSLTGQKENSRKSFRVFRPLLLWVLLVLVLYAHRTHLRLLESTQLLFTFTSNYVLDDTPHAFLDGKAFLNGNRVPLGFHLFELKSAKAVTFSTNLLMWYGQKYLGTIPLERARGTLKLTVVPPAAEVRVDGQETNITFRECSGTNWSVPTDTYRVTAFWGHFQQSKQVVVDQTAGGDLSFTPALGVLRIESSHSGTRYSLINSQNNIEVATGDLPVVVKDLPAGAYLIRADRGGVNRSPSVTVKQAVTNEVMIRFEYGSARIESTPPGADVIGSDGKILGRSPILLTELPSGTWMGSLQFTDYVSVLISLPIGAGQTNLFQTNLVNAHYAAAMRIARTRQDAGNLAAAAEALDEALKATPDDPAAVSLRRELELQSLVADAKSRISRRDYLSARKSVEKALKLSPNDQEIAKMLKDTELGQKTLDEEQAASSTISVESIARDTELACHEVEHSQEVLRGPIPASFAFSS